MVLTLYRMGHHKGTNSLSHTGRLQPLPPMSNGAHALQNGTSQRYEQSQSGWLQPLAPMSNGAHALQNGTSQRYEQSQSGRLQPLPPMSNGAHRMEHHKGTNSLSHPGRLQPLPPMSNGAHTLQNGTSQRYEQSQSGRLQPLPPMSNGAHRMEHHKGMNSLSQGDYSRYPRCLMVLTEWNITKVRIVSVRVTTAATPDV